MDNRLQFQKKEPYNVFVEFLFQGLLISANYYTRFNKKRNDLGGRIGIGYLPTRNSNLISIPIGINYLIGKRNNFFEMGLGATLERGVQNAFFFSKSSLTSTNSSKIEIVGTTNFSYRLQPINSGFSFRTGLTPIVTAQLIAGFIGLSLGYTF